MEIKKIKLEVVYALCEEQTVLSLSAAPGDSVGSVIARSGIADLHPELQSSSLQVGIFGRRVSLATPVADGDRVEIYRPLMLSPVEARRLRARAKKSAR